MMTCLTSRKGMGRQVKRAVMIRNNFRPQTSEREPMRGAERKLRNPLTAMITPFIIRALLCNNTFQSYRLNFNCIVVT